MRDLVASYSLLIPQSGNMKVFSSAELCTLTFLLLSLFSASRYSGQWHQLEWKPAYHQVCLNSLIFDCREKETDLLFILQPSTLDCFIKRVVQNFLEKEGFYHDCWIMPGSEMKVHHGTSCLTFRDHFLHKHLRGWNHNIGVKPIVI